MNFSDSQLKGYNTVEGDLDVAFSNQSIVAAFDEIPYLKLFTGRHCSKYTMVAPTYKTGGFGFIYSLSLIHGFKFWRLPDTNWAIHIWLLISPYHYLSPVIHNQYSWLNYIDDLVPIMILNSGIGRCMSISNGVIVSGISYDLKKLTIYEIGLKSYHSDLSRNDFKKLTIASPNMFCSILLIYTTDSSI